MLLEINFTLVLFAISFLIFIYLLNLTLYKPVGEVIEERKNLIDGECQKAKDLTTRANEMLENYKNQIKSVKQLAQNIIQKVVNEAQETKNKKISLVISELNKEKEEALKQLQEEEKNAIKKLEGEIKMLTDLITSKILGTGDKTLVGSH